MEWVGERRDGKQYNFILIKILKMELTMVKLFKNSLVQ